MAPKFENPQTISTYQPGSGLVPGAIPLPELPGLAALPGDFPLEKLARLRDLVFVEPDPADGGPRVAATYRFDYTLASKGVLSDTRNGGLRKDLTAAFENDTIFDRAFPAKSINPVNLSDPSYFALPPEKLSAASDLSENGYIHMGIFRDYYNLKRHIEVVDGVPVLHQPGLDWFDINQNKSDPPDSPLGRGTLGPHEMGPDNNDSQPHRNNTLGPHDQRPFGEIPPIFQTEQTRDYLHNPVGTTYAYLQVNGWLEVQPAEFDAGGAETSPQTFTTHAQLLTGVYNPYNINVRIAGRNDRGPKFMNWPQVFIDFPGVTTESSPGALGFGGSLLRIGFSSDDEIIPPGRSRVFSIEQNADRDDDAGQAYHGEASFGNEIAHLVDESFVASPKEWPGDPDQPVSASMTVTYNGRPVMSLGNMDGRWSGHDHDQELNQVFYDAFKMDTHNQSGAYVVEQTLTPSESVNRPFTFGLRLRTTRESTADAIRPLIDANIRARWNNPRWDSPLGMDHLAVFSSEVSPSDRVPQMDVSENPLGHLYAGAGRDPLDGTDRVILFDVPREDLVSMGQLQHASAGRFSYEPSYIVGNSYANPRIPLSDWRDSVSDSYSSGLRFSISGSFNLYDASYLVNQRLWDGYVFTTLPQVRDNVTPDEPVIDYPALRAGEALLANPRFVPYEPEGSVFTEDVLTAEGGGGASSAFDHNAGHVMVDGAFNINSTSVNAWEAFLTGTLDLPLRRVNEDGQITGYESPTDGRPRFPRVVTSYGGGMIQGSPDENFWTGFRELTRGETRDLAEAIVEQVKRRGPFLNLGEFVNRMLVDGEEGHAGPLQTALDATVNQLIPNRYAREANAAPGDSTQGAGFPGQLLQGDVLQALAPMMTARSDTFTIRAYGEVGDTGSPLAQAWCEMTVQRVPDPVLNGSSPDAETYLSEMANPSSPFGRRFKVVSFRWIGQEDI